MKIRAFSRWLSILVLLFAGYLHAESPVQQARDQIAARLIAKYTPDELLQLDPKRIEQEITDAERQVFATAHWAFGVNVPVVVSVIRDTDQEIVPFWLEERGFVKTSLVVRNENSTYEVWQKAFPAGRVELGINGFDKHRPHYLVAIGPQQPGDSVKLSNLFPPDQQVTEMRRGASTYHDWSELVLTEVPRELEGHLLLPTIRGRARDAHLFGGFRKSTAPSSNTPDNVVLTWSEDPKTTQTVQWRTAIDVKSGKVFHREKGDPNASWRETAAECVEVADFLVVNDPRVNHYTATLRGLKPATTYEYKVGGDEAAAQSEVRTFTTAPHGPAPFTFICLSDTHNSTVTAPLYAAALERYPKMSFWSISGDLVGTGQHRDDWDALFYLSRELAARFSFMPCVGNHDAIDGLGADLFCKLLELPRNGPETLQPERAYAFTYGDAFFILPDVSVDVAAQTPWMDRELGRATAKWKFAVLHFPPYGPHPNSEPDILRHWVPVFEKHDVDFVLSGHVHNYMRTYPLKNGRPVPEGKNGTVYLISVAVKGDRQPIPKPPYAAVLNTFGGSQFLAVTVDADTVTVRAEDETSNMLDGCTVNK